MNLCVFLVHGHTFSFNNVQIIHDNQTILRFEYTAMSDGQRKDVTFYKDKIAGVSRWPA